MLRAATVLRAFAVVLACLPPGLAGCGGLGEFGEAKAPSEDYVAFRNSLNRVGFYGPFKIGKVRPGKVRWEMEFGGIDAPEKEDVKQNKQRPHGDENAPAKRKRKRRKRSKAAEVRFHLKPALRDGFRIIFYPADDAIASFRKLKPGDKVTIEGDLSFIMFEKYYGQSVLPSAFELSSGKIPIDEENNEIKWNGTRSARRMRVGLLLIVGDVRPVAGAADAGKSP